LGFAAAFGRLALAAFAAAGLLARDLAARFAGFAFVAGFGLTGFALGFGLPGVARAGFSSACCARDCSEADGAVPLLDARSRVDARRRLAFWGLRLGSRPSRPASSLPAPPGVSSARSTLDIIA